MQLLCMIRKYIIVLVYVIVSPKIVPFKFGEHAVNASQSATLQCTVAEGDLPLIINWYKDGKPEKLASDDRESISIAKISRYVSVLSIEAVTASHIGNYTCSVKNTVGVSNHTAALFVNGWSFNVSQRLRNIIRDGCLYGLVTIAFYFK